MYRKKLFLLAFVLGILALAIALVWMLMGSRKAQQPPALPTGVRPSPPPTSTPGAATSTSQPPQADAEVMAQEAAKRTAMNFAARAATYSNTDTFSGIKTAGTQASAGVQAFLEVERQKLVEAHPLSGGGWGKTTRALSSRILTPLPILSKTSVQVIVETQQTTESSLLPPSTTYEEATLSLEKQGNDWIVSRITWKPMEQ